MLINESLGNYVLASHLTVLKVELPENLTLLNLRDNSLVSFADFHANCMALILGFTPMNFNLNTLKNMYQIDSETCEKETQKLLTYLLDSGILVARSGP